MSFISKDKDGPRVVSFFLNLYKFQMGVPLNAAARYAAVSSFNRSETTYELHIRSGTKWMTRRMSIQKIGGETGSVSKCYKVIFDDVLVVKIPGRPVRHFQEYLKNLQAEKRITDRMPEGIPFIAPRVSPVLKKIYPLPDGENMSELEMENAYIKWLEKNKGFENYLKIDESFVYFMELSSHLFYSSVMEDMHGKYIFKQEIRAEMTQHTNMLFDIPALEKEYGPENASACLDMLSLFPEYENKTRRLLQEHSISDYISEEDMRKWLLNLLAGENIRMSESLSRIPDEFIQDLQALIQETLDTGANAVKKYKSMISKTVRRRLFIRNQQHIEGLIYHLIRLISRLRNAEIAIRDLKPDNLFIAGDSDNYPLFLLSPNEYAVGLIDFETATETVYSNGQDIKQPRLAGTVIYATPSNFFPNSVLKQFYDDLTRILHFQDYYAAVGMIFTTVTGGVLFEKTGLILKEIIHQKGLFRKGKKNSQDMFVTYSIRFWHSAFDEFKQKTASKQEMFQKINIPLPAVFQEVLTNECNAALETMKSQTAHLIQSQVMFKKGSNHQKLKDASVYEIRRIQNQWQESGDSTQIPDQTTHKILIFLKHLERLKTRYEKQEKILYLLEPANPVMDALQLMEIIFYLVLSVMYKSDWEKLNDTFDAPDAPFTWEDDLLESDAIVYEDTIGIFR